MTYEELTNCLLENGIQLDSKKVDLLKRYVAILLKWNESINLTAIRKEDEIVEKHLYDSFLPSLICDFHNKNIIDVGSGAGFPGIPLAILYPDAKFVLLEPISKKANFLSTVLSELNLTNVSVVVKRAEDFKEKRGTFDIAISRAVASLNILLELCIPLIKVNGYFIAMKSQKADEEIDKSANAIKKLNCDIASILKDTLPSNNDIRCNILFKKMLGTDVKYPRPYATILKRPL